MKKIVNTLTTGNLFLDNLIDGVNIGTIVLLVEDSPTKISESFLKYFMAEGIVKEQKVFLYTSNPSTKQKLSSLPYKSTQVETILNTKRNNDTSKGEIKIAWRYENIKYANVIEDIVKSTDYIFDLSRALQDNFVKQNPLTINPLDGKDVVEVLKNLVEAISTDYTNYSSSLNEDEIKFSRFVVPNLFENAIIEEDSKSILNLKLYLNSLKNLARSLNGVIYLTLSKEFLSKKIFNYIFYYSDYSFSLRSFLLSPQKLEEYDAVFTINKLPKLCSLRCPVELETETYGVLVEKKKVVIEKVDLGPEIDRNTKVKEKDVKDLPASQAICGQEKFSKNYEF